MNILRTFSSQFLLAASALTLLPAGTASAEEPAQRRRVVYLHQADFDDGTYQITKRGTYILAEDITFNPHPVGSLADDGVTVLDAYTAGLPFPSQLGDPANGKYDPAAFGIGFFAALTIDAKNVVLNLNGHTIEQSAEHALLQRFFSVIELADQPFIPNQGPSGFGDIIHSARKVTIRNGTIGRSAHHGIHGNDNRVVTIRNVDFLDYEVAAVALNGVRRLHIKNSQAESRDDVPVLGTYSNARFIAPYVDWLVQSGSTTTLGVQGLLHDALDIQADLRLAINNVHEDVILDGLGSIDPIQHPEEYALFHNKHGIVDGNSYGYLINPLGAAVGGFPYAPTPPARRITLTDVHVLRQHSFVNEVVALRQGSDPARDPVGALFMVRNRHPDTGLPVTVSSLNESSGTYTGNALANAQALVAKAAHNNEFPSFLDVSRLNITPEIVDWIENEDTLDVLVSGPSDYLCNGDTMFHVNKGVIGYRIDGAARVTLDHTSASDLVNLGNVGSDDCGCYSFSHPEATLSGYGGTKVRGYSFAGSKKIVVYDAEISDLSTFAGSAIGIDLLTDTKNVLIEECTIDEVEAGLSFVANGGPNDAPDALGFHIGADARNISILNATVTHMTAYDETATLRDDR